MILSNSIIVTGFVWLILEPHTYRHLRRPCSLFLPGLVPINSLLGLLRHHSLKVTHQRRNLIVCGPLNATSWAIGDPTFEFHLPWNEKFIPTTCEWRWPSKGTRPWSHPCTGLTTHSTAATHLEILELILHDCQFLWTNGLAFSSFLNSCAAFVRVLWVRVALHFSHVDPCQDFHNPVSHDGFPLRTFFLTCTSKWRILKSIFVVDWKSSVIFISILPPWSSTIFLLWDSVTRCFFISGRLEGSSIVDLATSSILFGLPIGIPSPSTPTEFHRLHQPD